MCEKRIEKAALGVDGVSIADWNKETKQLRWFLMIQKPNWTKLKLP